MLSPFYASNDITEIAEDYLERIQELVDKKGYARVTDIAEEFGISRSTVSTMVRKLAQRGFSITSGTAVSPLPSRAAASRCRSSRGTKRSSAFCGISIFRKKWC